jgi:hypothetical protein
MKLPRNLYSANRGSLAVHSYGGHLTGFLLFHEGRHRRQRKSFKAVFASCDDKKKYKTKKLSFVPTRVAS